MHAAVPVLLLAAFFQEDKPLEKGPIHEAYAQTFEAKPVIGPFLKNKPPDPLQEVPPEDKPQGEDVRWMPGYWHWDEERDDFIWISGFWRQIPPGKEWVAGRFETVQGQWRWVPGYWRDLDIDQEEFLEESPPAIPEIGPSVPAPGPQMIWASGYWVRQGFRWGWRPGVWIPQRPGWVWNPARWVFTPFGFTFVPGYWDYALEYRGLLYAPVYYPPAWVLRPGFCHRPRYLVCYQDLPCGLFTRRGFANYFYGDYFRPGYARVGFQFWSSTGIGPDPLFTYYRTINNDRWAREFDHYRRERYAGRPAVVPVIATNIVQNTTHVTNVTNINNNTNQTTINNRSGQVALGPNAAIANTTVTKTNQVRVVEAKQQPKVVLASNHPVPTPRDIPPSQIAPKGQGKPRSLADKPGAPATASKRDSAGAMNGDRSPPALRERPQRPPQSLDLAKTPKLPDSKNGGAPNTPPRTPEGKKEASPSNPATVNSAIPKNREIPSATGAAPPISPVKSAPKTPEKGAPKNPPTLPRTGEPGAGATPPKTTPPDNQTKPPTSAQPRAPISNTVPRANPGVPGSPATPPSSNGSGGSASRMQPSVPPSAIPGNPIRQVGGTIPPSSVQPGRNPLVPPVAPPAKPVTPAIPAGAPTAPFKAPTPPPAKAPNAPVAPGVQNPPARPQRVTSPPAPTGASKGKPKEAPNAGDGKKPG